MKAIGQACTGRRDHLRAQAAVCSSTKRAEAVAVQSSMACSPSHTAPSCKQLTQHHRHYLVCRFVAPLQRSDASPNAGFHEFGSPMHHQLSLCHSGGALPAMQAHKQQVANEVCLAHPITSMLIPALVAALGLGGASPPGR